MPFAPKRKNHLPTHQFSGARDLFVFREGNSSMKYKSTSPIVIQPGWWLNQPVSKICASQNGFIFPKLEVNITQIFELPPPSNRLTREGIPHINTAAISSFAPRSFPLRGVSPALGPALGALKKKQRRQLRVISGICPGGPGVIIL